jgi:hypothetical protein
MKRSSGIFAFVILAGIALVTMLSCEQRLAVDDKDKLKLEIGGPTKDDFVDLRQPDGKDALDAALRSLDAKQYKIRFKSDHGDIDEDYHPPTPTPSVQGDHASIKTDKTIKSEAANNKAGAESAVNDPNITYRVRGSVKDVKKVVDSFKEEQ